MVDDGPLERAVAVALAAGFIGMLVYGGVQLLGDLSASPKEKFLDFMHSQTDVGTVTDRQMLDAAKEICRDLDAGDSLNTIREGLEIATDAPAFADTLVLASIRIYCPAYKHLLE